MTQPLYLSFLLCIISVFSLAQTGHPIPPSSSTRLFYIQHDKNHNTFVYDANMASSTKIDEHDPVDIYRYIYTAGGVKEKLTKMQLRLAYGVRFKKIGNNHFELSLVSYPEKKFYLKLENKQPFIEITVNNKRFVLERMFLKQKEKSSILSPKLEYIIFYGKDRLGNTIQEKFIP